MTLPPNLKTGCTARRPPKAKGKKLNAGQRSLKALRDRGYTAEVCEQFKARVDGRGQAAIFRGGFRKDLFGFADIIAYSPALTLAVQTTSRQQMTAHLRAYRRDPAIVERIRGWLANPLRRLVIHGWEPLLVPCKSKAGTKVSWELTEREITIGDLAVVAAETSEQPQAALVQREHGW